MTTRRHTTSAKEPLGQTGAPIDERSDVTPAVAPATIAKLLVFTFAMITFPIGSYFLSVNLIFSGNTTYAGGLAAIIANVVLIGYVIVAFQDDKTEREIDAQEAKKAQ